MVKKTTNQISLCSRNYQILASCFVLSLISPLASAKNFYADWGMSVYGSQTSINSKTAAEQGVDDSLWLVGVSADYTKNNWITSLGIEAVFYDDQLKFTQKVEGNEFISEETGLAIEVPVWAFEDGFSSIESSKARGTLLFVASGYQWFYGEKQNTTFRLQGGYSDFVRSERAISNCSYCYSEDIDIDAGAFIRAGLMHSGDSFSYGIHIQQYMGDGLKTGVGITIASAF